jgi:heterodisulfide reductase subunit C/nitrate reductase gamma subunit
MFYSISLYSALAIFAIGLIYKIVTWFSLKTTADAKAIPGAKRLSAALKGITLTLFSPKIGTLIKTLLLDIILQRKVFKQDLLRWVIHLLIYVAFTLLLLMHALGTLITSALFATYSPTINPFLLLRDLLGLLVVIGICLAIYRRYILRTPRLTTTPMDLYAIILVATIILSGIMCEAVKIGSYSIYKHMVTEYAGIEEGEEDFQALTAFWVKHFGTVSPTLKGPFEAELLETGRELHEMSCAGCHSQPRWAFVSYPVARALKGVALSLDKAGIHSFLWYIHVLASLMGLTYLPFSKLLHLITSPLSLLANSVMDAHSDPANIATKQALELDACMHCGQCTNHCSVGVVFEQIPNPGILPSEKLPLLKGVVSGRKTDQRTLKLIIEGVCLCTNCHRCTEVCPAGINLEELWAAMREKLFERDLPQPSLLSPLSFYRGLRKEEIPEAHYKRPLIKARQALSAHCELIREEGKPIALTPANRELPRTLGLSAQAATFSFCFGCQSCTNVCPVVASYENPKEVLGMLPHQIMYAAGLGIQDLAFGSGMLWDCITCYQCQEHCPQGVKVTEVLYELKNLAIRNAAQGDQQLLAARENGQAEGYAL